MQTLLDRHLATFDAWLHAHFMLLDASSRPHHYLAVITLLDQLNPKEIHWQRVSVILQHQLPGPCLPPQELLDLFSTVEVNIEFTRIVSKFLVDRDRAGCLWVNSHNYADLATSILEILCDK